VFASKRRVRHGIALVSLTVLGVVACPLSAAEPDAPTVDDPAELPAAPNLRLIDPLAPSESGIDFAGGRVVAPRSLSVDSPRSRSVDWTDWTLTEGESVLGALSLAEVPPLGVVPMQEGDEPIDDRSWWARWNSSIWGVSITVQGVAVIMLLGFTRLPSEVSGWSEPRFEGLKGNFTKGPRVDNDRIIFNYVGHPLAGSEFHVIARNRGLNAWESLAYGFAMSTFFEFFVESAYERASWQDLWITPVSGMVFGELRWQAKKALEDKSTGKPKGTLNQILYVVLDPFDPIFNL
jgi:hypothetical protein